MSNPRPGPSRAAVRAAVRAPARARAAARAIALALALAAVTSLIGAARSSVAADELELEPFQASYLWIWNGATVALSTLRLTHGPDELWSYSSSTAPRGLGILYPIRPKLQSTMRIDAHGVQPLAFQAQGGGARRDADLKFDWDAHRVTGNYEGAKVDLPLVPGIHDDLSVQIALMVQLLHGITPETLSMIDKNSVRDYLYKREGEETLATALGQVKTIVYSSQHPGSPRITRYWCAPSIGYIPMQVQQKLRDHVEWTMKIRSVQRE